MKRILFVAAMLAGAAAGHLFYMERFTAGGAFLVMTALLLWFASRPAPVEEELEEHGLVDDAALEEMALLVADLALGQLKGIGRTVPPSTKEINQLEERLDALLNHMGVRAGRRAALDDEFERLRGRTRLSEGGMALARSARL